MSILHRGGAEEARGAHNSEVVGSNPTSGIHSNSPALQKLDVIVQATLNMITLHFTDVAQRDAHGAHNSKATGSTPVVGKSYFCF